MLQVTQDQCNRGPRIIITHDAIPYHTNIAIPCNTTQYHAIPCDTMQVIDSDTDTIRMMTKMVLIKMMSSYYSGEGRACLLC